MLSVSPSYLSGFEFPCIRICISCMPARSDELMISSWTQPHLTHVPRCSSLHWACGSMKLPAVVLVPYNGSYSLSPIEHPVVGEANYITHKVSLIQHNTPTTRPEHFPSRLGWATTQSGFIIYQKIEPLPELIPRNSDSCIVISMPRCPKLQHLWRRGAVDAC